MNDNVRLTTANNDPSACNAAKARESTDRLDTAFYVESLHSPETLRSEQTWMKLSMTVRLAGTANGTQTRIFLSHKCLMLFFERKNMGEQVITWTDISVASLRCTEICNIKIWFRINPDDFNIQPNNSLSASKRVIIKRKQTSTRSRWGNLFTNYVTKKRNDETSKNGKYEKF